MSLWSAITSFFTPTTSAGTSTMELGNSFTKGISIPWTPRRSMLPLIGGLLLVGILFSTLANAQTTYTAASCSQSDFEAKVGLTVEGDTIIIPSGTCTWGTNTNGIDHVTIINHAISIQGAVPCSTVGSSVGAATSCSTVIVNNIFPGSGMGLISMNSTTDLNVSWRIHDLQINEVTGDPSRFNLNHFTVSTRSHSFRFDHIYKKNLGPIDGGSHLVLFDGDGWGVVDHTRCGDPGDRPRDPCWITYHDDWGAVNDGACNGPSGCGDNSWSAASTQGTSAAIYIENSENYDTDSTLGAGAIDPQHGGRFVFRFNIASFLASHGTESSGRFRGIRQGEIYNNTLTSTRQMPNGAVYFRGGTAMMFNNTLNCLNNDCVTNPYGLLMLFATDRAIDALGFTSPLGVVSACDGTGAYDSTDGVIYASGNASASSSTNNLVVAGSPWTNGQWAGGDFAIRNVTQNWGSQISASGTNSITNYHSVFGQARNWAANDAFEVRKVYPCVDQVGRGSGDLLTGANPIPAAWPHQASAPVYVFNNTPQEGAIGSGSQETSIKQNRDWYQDVGASCSGATCVTGVGSGLRASRPSSCVTGTAWWATDGGTNWNTTNGSGVDGGLDLCSSTNTWTNNYYVPFTYPHPLISGSPPPPTEGLPQAPTNLEVS